MPFQQTGELRIYTFDLFQGEPLDHGVFTRQGGTSSEPWASLNVGGTVGDQPECVAENRRLSFAALNRPFESLFDVWQVHSADTVVATAPRPPHLPHQKADAILTSNPAVTLFMRFADCVPIFLWDPVQRVAGLVHAGWLGTVRNMAGAAVEAMQVQYGTRPEDLLAGIGPSIGAHHYEVGPEVVDQVRQVFGKDAEGILIQPNGTGAGSKVQFDLWAANRLRLEAAGVRQIEIAGICTACRLEDWYSHRGEHGRTGRFGALLGIR